jgi:hypothetical protein
MSCVACKPITEFYNNEAICKSGGDVSKHFFKYRWELDSVNDTFDTGSSKWQYGVKMQIIFFDYGDATPFNNYDLTTKLNLSSQTGTHTFNTIGLTKDTATFTISFKVEFTPELTADEVLNLDLNGAIMKPSTGGDPTRIVLVEENR